MSQQHVSEDHLDQYALGTLAEAQLPAMEEHLLICAACQARLQASDEFAGLFRTAAVQPDARPAGLWRRFARPMVGWAAAAAVAASLVVIVAQRQEAPAAPAIVALQSLRGTDSAAQIAAGKPAFLQLDVTPAAGQEPYEVRIVDPLGAEVLRAGASIRDGRLGVFVNKLRQGGYWVRLYRKDGELVAEYGLNAR